MNDAIPIMRCIECRSEVKLYGATKFVCSCGGLYDVCHPKVQYASSLLDVFDQRAIPNVTNPESMSGVWRFRELVFPSISSSEIVTLGEGLAPFWQAGNRLRKWVGGDLDLWIMPEGLGPTGSFKDNGGTVAISVAKKSGVKTIVCASTGDTSAMAAAYGAKAGMTCAVVLPKGKVTDVQLAQPIAHGAKVILIPGNFDDCMRVVGELVRSERAFPINSINPTRIEGHQATVFLATQFFGWKFPDVFVVPVGNGSNSSSIGKGIRCLRDNGLVSGEPKIIGAQSKAANPLAHSWEMSYDSDAGFGVVDPERWAKKYKPVETVGETTATAALIGNPVSYKKVMREINASRGSVLTAKEDELNEAVLVAGSDGHFVCPQTGTAIAGLRQAVSRGFVRKGQRVVLVSTATGLKFSHVPVQFGKNAVIETKTCETEEVAGIIEV
ncbi:MAG TPA: threonine synthase [Candidatus Paceibacterota bacterium]|nr:threonine synthase [Candidatus Paceibacterota bacterium]